LTFLDGKKTDIVDLDWRPVELQMNYPEYNPVRNGNGKIDYWETERIKIRVTLEWDDHLETRRDPQSISGSL